MNPSEYREVENSIAETLRVFLDSKQKLTPFERTCRDSLTRILGDVVRLRSPAPNLVEHELHERR